MFTYLLTVMSVILFIVSAGLFCSRFLGKRKLTEVVEERDRLLKVLALNKTRLDSLLYLYELHGVVDEDRLLDLALEESVSITESEGGYIHFVSTNGQGDIDLSLFRWSSNVQRICEANNSEHYPLSSAGIWADSIRTGDPVIHNDYDGEPNKCGMPDGHFPVNRHMSVPIYDNNEIVVIVGVGNKKDPYTEEDANQLDLFMRSVWNVLKRKRSECALNVSEDKYRRLFNELTVGFALHEVVKNEDDECVNYRFLEVNPAFEKLTGVPEEKLIGKTVLEVMPDVEQLWLDRYCKVADTGIPDSFEDYSVELDRYYSVVAYSPSPGQFAVLFNDVTDRVKWNTKVLQSQRLEAMGTLAGGIAHDFNNILSPIIGYAELLQFSDITPDVKHGIDQILKAGHRAKSLVQQILSFSRPSDDYKSSVDILPIMKESIKLLRAATPTYINMDVHFNNLAEAVVFCNPVYIQQIIMNLGVNAGQAIDIKGSSSGEIKFVFQEEFISEFNNMNLHLKSGRYLMITVEDTGIGISKHIRSKIFDPFFTTKEGKNGTGLGLSIVHNIVMSMDGDISMYSKENVGTSFKIYLPISDQPPEGIHIAPAKLVGGNECVLLVDDEPMVLDVTKQLLTTLGYEVYDYTDPDEALYMFVSKPDKYDIIITDYTMHRRTGLDLAKEIISMGNDIPIIICTGFSDRLAEEKEGVDGNYVIMHKPWTSREFASKVREVLDTAKKL